MLKLKEIFMIPAGCEVNEIGDFLGKKILENGEKVESLTIIDSYFFSENMKKPSITQDIMIRLLNSNETENFEGLEYIKIITSTKKYNKLSKEKKDRKIQSEKNNANNLEKRILEKKLAKFSKLEVLDIGEKFHDRFWIINERKAFIVGASINGMGSKHFYIQDDFLTQRDTETLLCLYTNGDIKNNMQLRDICNDSEKPIKA